MSMLDALFKGAFKGSKCKTLLKLTIPRIKLLRNRREIQIKQMRKDIAKLLETGQEATARIRVEHIIREENMMSAQEIIELFCELIVVRLPIIEIQRECPLDLKEAISSVCFAAPRCADLPELQQVQMLFISKYGKEFVAAATELMPDCGVNRQLIELLSIRAPSPEVKLKLLKEISEEYEVDWDPAASETEFLKPHEDLLNGPSQFVSGSKLPLPKEKHDISLPSSPVQASHEKADSDTGFFDELDFPEIPKVAPRPTFNTKSTPQMCFLPLPDTLDFGDDDEVKKYSEENENPRKSPHLEPEKVVPSSISTGENKQFLPFVSPPSFSSKENKPSPSISRTKSEVHVDLQDVLAAAHAAAESAEQAAAAARSAASLAQVRITELIKKRDDPSSKYGLPTFHKDGIDGTFSDPFPDPGPNRGSETLNLPSYETHKVGDEPQISDDQVPDHGSTHRRPERLTSIEDDPYFSYPNLFSRQNSNLASDIHSPADISASTREN